VEEFLAFLGDAELIIHNAPFDLAFLRHEMGLLGKPPERFGNGCAVIDTLTMARNLHPGQKNSLDALCRRYDIDNSQRTLHGALLDAEILADVYLAMTGGQSNLLLERDAAPGQITAVRRLPAARPRLPVLRADEEELAAHRARLEAIERQSGAPPLWSRLGLD
jgi:DNA polymerase-3 subunit epsilon